MANQVVYAPKGVFQFKGSWKKISDALALAENQRYPVQIIQRWDITKKNKHGVYPLRYAGTPTSKHGSWGGPETDDGAQPDGTWQFTRTWKEMPLDQVKDRAKEQVKNWKHSKQKEDFTYDGVEYEADDLSRDYIGGAVLSATVSLVTSQPFTIDWTAADNSIVTHDATSMIAMGQSLAKAIGGFHDQSTQLKKDINTAADEAAVLAILDGLK